MLVICTIHIKELVFAGEFGVQKSCKKGHKDMGIDLCSFVGGFGVQKSCKKGHKNMGIDLQYIVLPFYALCYIVYYIFTPF